MIARQISHEIFENAREFPAIAILGPRQSGTEDTFRITALNFYRDIQKGILK